VNESRTLVATPGIYFWFLGGADRKFTLWSSRRAASELAAPTVNTTLTIAKIGASMNSANWAALGPENTTIFGRSHDRDRELD